MARRGVLVRRSATEWGVRGLMAAGAAAASYASVTRTLAYSIRGDAVERAHDLAPGDGRITALLSEKLSGPWARPAERARSGRLARLALVQEPTAVAAVATLGINAELRDDSPSARRLFAYARSLSRRDFRTHLWAVEDAVARGDVAGALRAYDIALRTSRYAPGLLFPVLATAIEDPAIRTALVATLARRPAWGPAFIEHAVVNGPDQRVNSIFFQGLHRAGFPVSEGVQTALISALASSGLFDEAWSYYRSVRPGVDRRRSRDGGFSAFLDSPTAFDWTLVNEAGVTASIQRGERGGVFDFAAPASVGGVALRQLQLLPPGVYRLEGRSAGLEQASDARPYWALTCGDGRELGRVAVPDSAEADGVFTGRFVVPAGCPVQTLSLVVRPSDAVGGVTGRIEQVRLHPMN